MPRIKCTGTRARNGAIAAAITEGKQAMYAIHNGYVILGVGATPEAAEADLRDAVSLTDEEMAGEDLDLQECAEILNAQYREISR